MSEASKQKWGPKLRSVLLTLQIVLPFVMYSAMKAGNRFFAAVIAVLIGLSMLTMVVIK